MHQCIILQAYMTAMQGNADRHVEEDVAVEHEKDPVGAEVADADMAAAGEDDDGVTPQKRKTPLDDVVTHSCTSHSFLLLQACPKACIH